MLAISNNANCRVTPIITRAVFSTQIESVLRSNFIFLIPDFFTGIRVESYIFPFHQLSLIENSRGRECPLSKAFCQEFAIFDNHHRVVIALFDNIFVFRDVDYMFRHSESFEGVYQFHGGRNRNAIHVLIVQIHNSNVLHNANLQRCIPIYLLRVQ